MFYTLITHEFLTNQSTCRVYLYYKGEIQMEFTRTIIPEIKRLKTSNIIFFVVINVASLLTELNNAPGMFL